MKTKKFGNHGVITKGGITRSPQELKEMRERARILYVKGGEGQASIARTLNVTQKTVHEWKRKDKWDQLVERAEKAKEKALLKELAGQVTTNQVVNEDWVLLKLRQLADEARAESVQLGATKLLGEHLGMFETEGGEDEGSTVFELVKPDDEEAEGEGEGPKPEAESGKKDEGASGVEVVAPEVEEATSGTSEVPTAQAPVGGPH